MKEGRWKEWWLKEGKWKKGDERGEVEGGGWKRKEGSKAMREWLKRCSTNWHALQGGTFATCCFVEVNFPFAR